MHDLEPTDEKNLLTAIDVASRSRSRGNHPFGAVLTDPANIVLYEAENTVVSESDVTGHAETNLVRAATRELTATQLSGCTLYSSAEPCAMCAGSIYWSGIGRVVYALSEMSLLQLTGAHPENPTLSLPCRDVFARGQRDIAVVGPALSGPAGRVHEGFWA